MATPFFTPGEFSDSPGSIKKDPNWFVVTVLGYRRVRFDTVAAIHRLRDDLSVLRDMAKSKGLQPVMIADGTDIGVVGLAYREARKMGITVIGLTPKAAQRTDEPMFPVDMHQWIEGDFDGAPVAFQYAAMTDVCLYYGNKNPVSSVMAKLNTLRKETWFTYLEPKAEPAAAIKVKRPPLP